MRSVRGDECLVLGWQFVEVKDRARRTDRDARAAIDAVIRVHIKLRSRREIGFVFRGMNAIHRAGFDAVLIFGAGILQESIIT
jgi:hypothetical protein